LIAEARARGGQSPARRLHLAAAAESTPAYHFECARIALRAGEQRTAMRHACVAIGSAPGWLAPYAVLAACFVPPRAVPLVARVLTRIGTS